MASQPHLPRGRVTTVLCGHYHQNHTAWSPSGIEFVTTSSCGGCINWAQKPALIAPMTAFNFKECVRCDDPRNPPVVCDAFNSGLRVVRVEKERIERAFRLQDRDHSGVIEGPELRRALGELGLRSDDASILAALARHDLDHSGGLDLWEFTTLVRDVVTHQEKETALKLASTVKAFSSALHAHQVGNYLEAWLLRDGVVVGNLGGEDPYDFNFQRFLPLDAGLINIHNPAEALILALAGTLAGGLLCAMALVWLLDKRLLAWTRFISDESFVAAVLLGGGAALLLFVGLVVGLGAIFDGLKLAEALFGLIQESVRGDTEWGRWFEESLLEVRTVSYTHLTLPTKA